MTTFVKAKIEKSDDQTNIDKYRVAAITTENHIISKLVKIRQLFHVKLSKIKMFKIDVITFQSEL